MFKCIFGDIWVYGRVHIGIYGFLPVTLSRISFMQTDVLDRGSTG